MPLASLGEMYSWRVDTTGNVRRAGDRASSGPANLGDLRTPSASDDARVGTDTGPVGDLNLRLTTPRPSGDVNVAGLCGLLPTRVGVFTARRPWPLDVGAWSDAVGARGGRPGVAGDGDDAPAKPSSRRRWRGAGDVGRSWSPSNNRRCRRLRGCRPRAFGVRTSA